MVVERWEQGSHCKAGGWMCVCPACELDEHASLCGAPRQGGRQRRVGSKGWEGSRDGDLGVSASAWVNVCTELGAWHSRALPCMGMGMGMGALW